MDLGNLRFQVAADTSDLNRARGEMHDFTDEAKRTDKEVDELGEGLEQTGKKGRTSIAALVRAINENTAAMRRASAQNGKLGSSVDKARASITAAASSTRRLTQDTKEASRAGRAFGIDYEKASKRVVSSTERARASVGGLRSMLFGLTAYFGGREVVSYSDNWNNAANQLRMVTDNTQQLTAAQEDLLGIANDTRSEFGSTANLYSRLARSTTELNLSYTDLLGLTKTINQAFAVSGATTEEASAAITQLSQGLASGALRGDEFNSVAEQAPSIMRAIADSLGMTIGQLRAFAATGGITAEIVVNALQGVSDSMDSQFSRSVATFGQNMIVARNNMTAFIGESSILQGIISGIGSTVQDVSFALSGYTDSIDLWVGSIGGAVGTALALTTAVKGLTKAHAALNVVVRANPYVLAATAVGALLGALYALRNETLEVGETSATVGQWVMAAWELATETIVDLWRAITAPIKRALDQFRSYFGESADGTATSWQTAMDAIVSITKWTINGLISAYRGVAAAIAQIFYNMADNIATVFNGTIDAVKAAAAGDWDGVTKALDRELINPFSNVMDAFVAENKDYLSEWGNAWADRVQRNSVELKTLDQWLFKVTESNRKLGVGAGMSEEELKKQKKALEALRKESEQFAQSVQQVMDKVDPVGAAYRAYAADQQVLNAAVARGVISLDQYFDAMQKLRALQQSPQAASQVYGEGFGAEIGSRGAPGAPTQPGTVKQEKSPMEQWLEGARTAFTDFEAMSANVADNFTTQFGNAFQSVIMQTSSLREAFSELATSMLGSIVNAIGQMIAQWIAYQAVTMALGSQSSAAAVTEAAVAGPAIASAYAPAAAATSLATFGANSGPAIAGITATNSVAQGFAGMFDKGGKLGRGQWGIAGEKGGEIVSGPATITSRRETGRMMGSGGAPNVNVVVNDPGVSESEGATATMMDDGTLDIRVARLVSQGNTKTARSIHATTGTQRRGTK